VIEKLPSDFRERLSEMNGVAGSPDARSEVTATRTRRQGCTNSTAFTECGRSKSNGNVSPYISRVDRL